MTPTRKDVEAAAGVPVSTLMRYPWLSAARAQKDA